MLTLECRKGACEVVLRMEVSQIRIFAIQLYFFAKKSILNSSHNYHQLPPPPPPKPPPEEPPPEDDDEEGVLTILDCAVEMLCEKDLEKAVIPKNCPLPLWYQLGGGMFNASNFAAHLSSNPKASA